MIKNEQDKPKETPPFENDLRDDLLLGSQAIPDRSLFRERLSIFTPAKIISLAVALILLILGWFLFAGPGKPTMEKLLTKLSERVLEPTKNPLAVVENPTVETRVAFPATITTTPLQVSKSTTPVIPSKTMTSTPTQKISTQVLPTTSPTQSPVPVFTPTSTPTEIPTATIIPTTSILGCVTAASVSTADVGKTLCVTGNVLRTESNPNSFLIILENPKDAFYFLSYDRKWEDLEEGKCVFATGKILQLGNNPVMILDYKIPLEYCP